MDKGRFVMGGKKMKVAFASRFKIKRADFKPGSILIHIFMLMLVCFTALPLIYMISTAFKPLEELFLFPPRFFVRRPTITNFYDLFAALSTIEVPFSRYVFNSVFVTVITVIFTVMVSGMGSYGLVKHNPPGAPFIMVLVISALMFTPHVTLIPTYMVVNQFNMIDTYWALIIPRIAISFNFFLMERFMRQVPDALIESARIDGAREFRVFWSIVMPCVKPAWATLVVFSFVTSWNDFFTPLIFTSSQTMKTLPLSLQLIAGGPGAAALGRAGAVAAATFLMTLPTIILFTVMQKKVIETMSHSGIKA